MSTFVLSHPLIVIEDVIKNFFLLNFIAPFPGIINNVEKPGDMILSFFRQHLDYKLIGFVGVVVWLSLFTIGFFKNLTSARNMLFKVASCALLFNAALHSIFGMNEMFLYTCNFTFPVLLLSLHKPSLKTIYFRGALIFLTPIMAINNFTVIKSFIKQ